VGLPAWARHALTTHALTGRTITDLAEESGHQRVTLSRWANEPEGRALIDEVQREHFDELRRTGYRLAEAAVACLLAALTSGAPERVAPTALQLLDRLGLLVAPDPHSTGKSAIRESLERKILQAADRFGI